jgi:prolyl-tRNA synthetase
MAAVAEQFNDEKGLVWPAAIAPFELHLIAINMKDEAQAQLAGDLYSKLRAARYDVLFDDRQERPGVKFADSDLIGMPIRITVGKKANEGIVEVKVRKTGDMQEIHVDELQEAIENILKTL